MNAVPDSLRSAVIHRAGGRCEYCLLSQTGQEATFHVDHIDPISAGGASESSNLALACVSCSLRKGARRTVVDPISGESVPLFHPRSDDWHEHFFWNAERIVGRTATGRATVEALAMNRPIILAIRCEETLRGRHPPSTG
ncbi:MAG: HNH endonuclease [Planctomycetia bacterium]|nr:HNH endonuclease [Planctomycetia bacterium]